MLQYQVSSTPRPAIISSITAVPSSSPHLSLPSSGIYENVNSMASIPIKENYDDAVALSSVESSLEQESRLQRHEIYKLKELILKQDEALASAVRAKFDADKLCEKAIKLRSVWELKFLSCDRQLHDALDDMHILKETNRRINEDHGVYMKENSTEIIKFRNSLDDANVQITSLQLSLQEARLTLDSTLDALKMAENLVDILKSEVLSKDIALDRFSKLIQDDSVYDGVDSSEDLNDSILSRRKIFSTKNDFDTVSLPLELSSDKRSAVNNATSKSIEMKLNSGKSTKLKRKAVNMNCNDDVVPKISVLTPAIVALNCSSVGTNNDDINVLSNSTSKRRSIRRNIKPSYDNVDFVSKGRTSKRLGAVKEVCTAFESHANDIDDSVGMIANKECANLKNHENQKDSIIQSLDIVISELDVVKQRVTISNMCSSVAYLDGWSIRSCKSNECFYFPKGFFLDPGMFVIISCGCRKSINVNAPPSKLWWKGNRCWDNNGDEAILLDNGGVVVNRKCAQGNQSQHHIEVGIASRERKRPDFFQ